MTPLQIAVRAAGARLAAAGVDSPQHDARALAVHALGLPGPGDLILVDDLGGHADSYDELVARRATRVPLQHLVGTVGFRYIELEVGPGVFVPRPETEAVVQWAVEALRGVPDPLVADLCAGSGTIALAIANEVPGSTVHAVERDPDALTWTRRNAANRVAAGDPEVQLHLGSAEDALPELDGQLDLIASNPPYVATTEAHIPDPEVLEHDPGIALWAGEDGLDVIRLVEKAARRLLKPGGRVVVEHSDRQGLSCPAIFRLQDGWAEVEDHRDQLGRDRFVSARWVGTP